jgi:hypothetical protein
MSKLLKLRNFSNEVGRADTISYGDQPSSSGLETLEFWGEDHRAEAPVIEPVFRTFEASELRSQISDLLMNSSGLPTETQICVWQSEISNLQCESFASKVLESDSHSHRALAR